MLTEACVLAFGRSCLEEIVGVDYPGEVFLAGGVFKTLLHGWPLRNYDLWRPGGAERVPERGGL